MKGFKNFAQVKKIIDRIKKFHNNWEGKESLKKIYLFTSKKFSLKINFLYGKALSSSNTYWKS